MIYRLRDLSIKRKLIIIIMMTSSFSLLLASLAFVTHDLKTLRNTMVENLSTMAEIVGGNSTAALIFRDPKTGKEILEALSVEPHILSAFLFDRDDYLFAQYLRKENEQNAASDHASEKESFRWDPRVQLPKSVSEGHTFLDDRLDLMQPIILDGERIGSIYIQHGLKEMNIRLLQYAGISSVVFLLSLFVSFFLSSRLQRVISKPILRLAQTMKVISNEQEYTVRVNKESNDELGVLIEGFNEMLEQIQVRDGELEQHRSHLEDQVSLRTAELQEALDNAYLMAQKAEAANTAKSAFLANMSHELRTPLNAVIGFSEVLQDRTIGETNPRQREYLQDIMSSGQHLLALVQDILDLSKIEVEKMELDLSMINLPDLLNSSIIMVREKAARHGIGLSVDVENAPQTFFADERKFKQVIFNILSNAVKFTPDNGKIQIHAEQVDRSRLKERVPPIFEEDVLSDLDDRHSSYLEISISDTGVGIKPESLKKIFLSFEQEDSSITRKYGGTGLGLSLCHKLVELHQGGIWVESRLGQGSRFSFVLPLTLNRTQDAGHQDLEFCDLNNAQT